MTDHKPSESEAAGSSVGAVQAALSDDEVRRLVASLTLDPSAVKAVIALGQRAAEPLLVTIGRDGLSWGTARAMVELRLPEGEGLLLRELDKPGGQREVAAAELGRIGSSLAIPRLRALLGDADAAVADEAAGSLGRLGDTESIEEIGRVARACEFDMVAAVSGLAWLGTPRARELLAELLDHSDMSVRLAAIDAVAQSRATVAFPKLLAIAEKADELELDQILRALSVLTDASALPFLVRIAASRNYRAHDGGPTLAELANRAIEAIRGK